MELLKIQGLTKVIKKKKIFTTFNCQFGRDCRLDLMCCKTTTIKMIMGLFHITEGEIKVCGHDVVTDFEAAMKM